MTTKAGLYYLAGALALAAAAITAFDAGFNRDEYFRVGFLGLMGALMFWLGSRDRPESND